MATAIKNPNDGRQWYILNGTDYGTGFEFENDQYATTEDGQILDSDGCPLTEGDNEIIAVRNTLMES